MTPQVAAFPEVVDLSEEAYGPHKRLSGEPYSMHPEWVSDMTVCIMLNMQQQFPDLITDDDISAAGIKALMHDGSEKNKDITPARLAKAAGNHPLAEVIGNSLMILYHNKGDDYLDYAIQISNIDISSVLVKTLDILHNLIVQPKPLQPGETYPTKYLRKILDYMRTIDYYVAMSQQHGAPAWLYPALKQALEYTAPLMSRSLLPAVNTWFTTTLESLQITEP